MSKMPAFQFYCGDWMKDPDLRRCTPAARGCFMDILCLMFENNPRGVLTTQIQQLNTPALQNLHSIFAKKDDFDLQIMQDNFKPWTVADVANCLSGVDKRTALKLINELLNNNVIKRLPDGSMYSKRMVKDEIIRIERKSSGATGGIASALKRETGQAKRKEKERSSSSSSSSKNIYGCFDDEIKPHYPKRDGSNPWRKAAENYNARLKEGKTAAAMLAGVRRYADYCNSQGIAGTKMVMQATRFFGRECEFENDWIVTAQTIQKQIKLPARGDCNAWVRFAIGHGIKTKAGESQYDFEKRVKNILHKND